MDVERSCCHLWLGVAHLQLNVLVAGCSTDVIRRSAEAVKHQSILVLHNPAQRLLPLMCPTWARQGATRPALVLLLAGIGRRYGLRDQAGGISSRLCDSAKQHRCLWKLLGTTMKLMVSSRRYLRADKDMEDDARTPEAQRVGMRCNNFAPFFHAPLSRPCYASVQCRAL